MKKIITILLVFTAFLNLNAQFSMQSIKEFEKFKLTKTYVVLHDSNPDFNNRIKKAIEKNWTLTPYEFIQFKDFKNYSGSDKNSFILVSDFSNTISPTVAYSFYTNGKKEKIYTYGTYGSTTLNLQLGGAKYFNSYTNWLAFADAGLRNSTVNSAKLIHMIKFLENTAILHLQRKVKNLKVTSGDSYKIYNLEKSLLNKTLILLDTEIPYFNDKNKKVFTTDNVKENFTGKIKVVNNNELSQIIDSNDTETIYFGSYVEGSFSAVYLYDNSGKIYFIEKMNRMSFNAPESKGWFISV